ncbi:MAG: ferrochelatase [Bergeyella sp.]|nr:ferrochelatase [Bergeyella sp.]
MARLHTHNLNFLIPVQKTQNTGNHSTQDNKKGILLVNLGSPRSTEIEDVKNYLDEFLMDEKVIDYRWFFRNLLVRGIILRTRPKKSAEAYKTVWTPKGSPLIVYTEKLRDKLLKKMNLPVEIAMRYAQPSIENGMKALAEKGVTQVVLFPLYPQYAMSTTETVIEKAEEVKKEKFSEVQIHYVTPFYNKNSYLDALAKSIKENLPKEFDALMFSYHGIPERHLYKTDPTGTCRIGKCCFEKNRPSHQFCYRHQCYKTTEEIAKRLHLPKDRIIVSFQSRLGKDKWIEPYTDETLEKLPKKGIKNLVVCCPAFVSDCLETLEEIAIGGKNSFLRAGGENFHYIPCLNDNDAWVEVIKELSEEKLNEFYLI